jgi:hypothetical protein
MEKSFHSLFLVTPKPMIRDHLEVRDPQVENHYSTPPR